MADLDALPAPVRAIAGLALVGGIGLLVQSTLFDRSAVTLVVYNGHDQPVEALVGPWSGTVDARASVRLEGFDGGVHSVEVRAVDQYVIDQRQISLDQSIDGVAVLNLNQRGLLAKQVLRYIADDAVPRPAPPPPPRVLDPGQVHDVSDLDYVLEAPPAEWEFEPGKRYADATVLIDLAVGVPLSDQLGLLVDHGYPDAVPLLVTAELEVDPADAEALTIAPRVLGLDRPGLLMLAKDLRTRAPDAVDVHRFYQDAALPINPDAVLAEYASLAEKQPESAAFTYLYGRILDPGEPATRTVFERAHALDPSLPQPRLALGNLALLDGDSLVAEAHLAAYAASGPGPASVVLDGRLRAALSDGAQPWSSRVQAVMADSQAQGVSGYQLVALEGVLRAGGTDADLAELDALGAGMIYEPTGATPTVQGISARWQLAFARGDLERGRVLLDSAPNDVDLALPRFLQSLADGEPSDTDQLIATHASMLAQGGVRTALMPAAWARARQLPQAAELALAAAQPGGAGSPHWVLDGGDPRTDSRMWHVVPTLRAAAWAAAAILWTADADASQLAWQTARRWALPGELPAG